MQIKAPINVAIIAKVIHLSDGAEARLAEEFVALEGF
jgi:hypothetical protein